MDSKVILALCIIFFSGSYAKETDTSTKYSNPKDLAKLINNIGQYWNMSSIYIIYNSKAAHNRYVHDVLEELHQQDTYFARLPHMTVTDANIERQLYEDRGFCDTSLVLTLMHSAYDSILETTARATRNRRSCFTIYVVQLVTQAVEQHNFFEQLWKYQLRRPLVIVNGKDLLTMDPYPKLRIVNVTEEHLSKLFPLVNNIKDFKGYSMDMPIQTDLPYSFWYTDKKTHKYRLDGLGGWIISELMDRLNVTMQLFPLYSNNSNFLDIKKINKLILSGQIEISPHLYTTFVKHDFDYSYPFVTTTRCIMMPITKRDSMHFPSLMHWTLWLLVAIFVFFLGLFWTLYNRCVEKHFRRRTMNRVSLIPRYRSLHLMCILLGIPTTPWRLPPLKRMYLLRFIRLLVVVFLVRFGGSYTSHMFSSNLTSFMTASYFEKPSATLEDLFASDIPLMMFHLEYKSFMKHFKIKHEYLHHIVNASWEEVNINRSNLNDSYMYLVSAEEFQVIDEQQKYMNPKRFVLSDICHGTYPFQMQLRADSHFTDPLQMFIMRLRERGLTIHQKSNIFQRAKEHGKLDYIRDVPRAHTARKYLTFNTMSVMLLVLSVGYTCSIVVFLMELYGHRFLKMFK